MQRIFTMVFPALAIAGAMIAAAATAAAQTAEGRLAIGKPALEFAFTYEGTLSNATTSSHFWMQGGGAQIHGQFYHGLGMVADISGEHIANINSAGVGLDMVTATFGPRYTWSPSRSRLGFYAQGLVGQAWGMNSVFPNSAGALTTANDLAVKAGGGFNFYVAPHIALRVVEADYLRTQFPNSTNSAQNNLQLNGGFVLRLR
jgi:hypothetical protein